MLKLNKREFLQSDLGQTLIKVITLWDEALIELRHYHPQTPEFKYWDKVSLINRERWEIFQRTLYHFYGIEYHFTRTDEYFGLVTEDETDWLIKIEREV